MEDKIAIITGASGGIGRAIVIGFFEAGAYVLLVSRIRPTFKEVREGLKSMERGILLILED